MQTYLSLHKSHVFDIDERNNNHFDLLRETCTQDMHALGTNADLIKTGMKQKMREVKAN